jgi:hypothetical protein
MSSTSQTYRRQLFGMNWMMTVAALSVLAVGTVANAAFIGHDPNSPPGGTWDAGSDGLEDLVLQINNPVTTAATVDSFSFYQGNTTSTRFAALIVRPTSANHYSVVYSSGILDLTQAPFNSIGVQTVSIAPVAVQVGDIVASFGTGIAYDNTGAQDDLVYWQSQGLLPATMPIPTTTFTTNVTDGSQPRYNTLTDHRIYALAFNVAVPEPTSATIAILGMIGLCRIVRKRG